jgi:hypothetical protein
MNTVTAGQDIQLLIEYFDVCNAALEANRDSLPYKPIIALYDKIFTNRDVGIDIYDSDPGKIEATATVRLTNGMIVPVAASRAKPSVRFKFKRSYMEDVATHREEYVKHPEKLDWGWLKSRFGWDSDKRNSPRDMGPHS